MKRFVICFLILPLLSCCKPPPPPPPPKPQGVLVPWPPKPVAKKVVKLKPGEVARPEQPIERQPLSPPDEARPHDDEPNPGEIIQQSEKAKEQATDYVLTPNARPHVIDQLTILTRNVRRARNALEQDRLPNGQYDPAKIGALRQATDALEAYQHLPGN